MIPARIKQAESLVIKFSSKPFLPEKTVPEGTIAKKKSPEQIRSEENSDPSTSEDTQKDSSNNLPKLKRFQVAFNPVETNKLLKKHSLF